MEDFYKIYIGDYHKKEGLPASYTINGVVPRKHLKQRVLEIVSKIHQGLDVYILTPKGEVKAYYRDNLNKVFDK
jgi:cobalamin biosynthesis protein CbiD